jgi:hypothetical protein
MDFVVKKNKQLRTSATKSVVIVMLRAIEVAKD